MVILRDLHIWLHPELRLAVRAENVDVHSRLFPREKVEPVAFPFEYRRTHKGTVSPAGSAVNRGARASGHCNTREVKMVTR
jgi:hypothetical protein